MDAFATYLGKKLKFDAHYFVRGGFWLSLSQLITILAGILTTSLFAKYLTESEYGTYRYLLTLVAIFSYFSLTGIGQSLLQAAAKGFNNFYKESFKTNLLYNSGVVISAFCGFIYYFLNENIVLSLGCLLIMLLQPVINLFQYTPTTLIGSKKFKESTLLQSLKTVFVTSTALASILVTQNVLILFSAYLVANALVNLISTWYFRQTTENNVTPLKQQNKLITYAKGTTVRHLILNLSGKLDIVILFTQVGAMEVAAYSIATLIPDQVRGFVKNMSQMLVPKYSQTENTAIILKSFPKRSLQIFILSAICTLVYIATSPIIYSLLFPKFIDTIYLTQLFSLIILTNVVYLPLSLLMVKTSEKELYTLNIGGALFQGALFVMLIPTFGILGAIYTRILYRFIFTILTYVMCYKSK